LKEEFERLSKDLKINEEQTKEAEEKIQTNKASLEAAEKTMNHLKKQIEE